MNAKEKLFKKISQKDRKMLRDILALLLEKKPVLNVKKLEGGDFYRLRKGNFRIIFHYTKSNDVEIDSIRLRDEKTYKNK